MALLMKTFSPPGKGREEFLETIKAEQIIWSALYTIHSSQGGAALQYMVMLDKKQRSGA